MTVTTNRAEPSNRADQRTLSERPSSKRRPAKRVASARPRRAERRRIKKMAKLREADVSVLLCVSLKHKLLNHTLKLRRVGQLPVGSLLLLLPLL